jgi:hypothetical protein
MIIQSLEGIEIVGAEQRFQGLFDDYFEISNDWPMIATSDRNIRVLETLATVIRCIIIGE